MVGSNPTFATKFIAGFFQTFFSGVSGCAVSSMLTDLSKLKNKVGVMLMTLGLLLVSLVGAGAANLGW